METQWHLHRQAGVKMGMRWRFMVGMAVSGLAIGWVGYFLGAARERQRWQELVQALEQRTEQTTAAASLIYFRGLGDVEWSLVEAYQRGWEEGQPSNVVTDSMSLQEKYGRALTLVGTHDLENAGDDYHYFEVTIRRRDGEEVSYCLKAQMDSSERIAYKLLQRLKNLKKSP